MMLAKAKLASSITFIVLASFTIVTYDRQNMFIIQATGAGKTDYSLDIYDQSRWLISLDPAVIPVIGKSFLKKHFKICVPMSIVCVDVCGRTIIAKDF